MCWLFHKWGKWTAPENAEVSWFGNPYKECVIQTRTCTKCGLVDKQMI